MDVLDIGLLIASPFIGSFLALLAYRLPEHEDIVFAPSKCRNCGHALAIRDLIPFVSYAFDGAKCRFCSGRISATYPLVELGALLVTVSAIWAANGWLTLATCGFGWAMLVLFVTDVRTLKLPNAVTLPLIPIGLGVTYAFHGAYGELRDSVIGAIAGGAILFGTAMAYRLLRGRTGLGMGDVKLFSAAGAWLGWQALPLVMLGACLIVLAGAIVFRIARRLALNGRTMLPLGAGLAPAIYVIWLVKALAA